MPTSVSVIIPTFNRADLLERAIGSVLSQTQRPLEILVVDDHSTEDIQKVTQKFTQTNSVYYLQSSGRGVSAARNSGIRVAKGSLIALLDSDDEWKSDKIEKQIDVLLKNPTKNLVHTEEMWIRNGVEVSKKKKHMKSGGRIFDRCTQLCLISPSSVLIRKELFERVGLFDENFPVCEDFDLWLRITSQEEVEFIDEPLTLKHGGHADQLSMKHHSMDLWRVRALAKHLNNPSLTESEKDALMNSLKEKSQILKKGFLKYQNFEHLSEIEKFL